MSKKLLILKNDISKTIQKLISEYTIPKYESESKIHSLKADGKYSSEYVSAEQKRLETSLSDRKIQTLRKLDELKAEYAEQLLTADIRGSFRVNPDLVSVLHSGLKLSQPEYEYLARQYADSPLDLRLISDSANKSGYQLSGIQTPQDKIRIVNGMIDSATKALKDDMFCSKTSDIDLLDYALEESDNALKTTTAENIAVIPLGDLEADIAHNMKNQNTESSETDRMFTESFTGRSTVEHNDVLESIKADFQTLGVDGTESTIAAVDAFMVAEGLDTLTPYDLQKIALTLEDEDEKHALSRLASARLPLGVQFDADTTDFAKVTAYTLQDRSDLKAAQREREESNHAN